MVVAGPKWQFKDFPETKAGKQPVDIFSKCEHMQSSVWGGGLLSLRMERVKVARHVTQFIANARAHTHTHTPNKQTSTSWRPQLAADRAFYIGLMDEKLPPNVKDWDCKVLQVCASSRTHTHTHSNTHTHSLTHTHTHTHTLTHTLTHTHTDTHTLSLCLLLRCRHLAQRAARSHGWLTLQACKATWLRM